MFAVVLDYSFLSEFFVKILLRPNAAASEADLHLQFLKLFEQIFLFFSRQKKYN